MNPFPTSLAFVFVMLPSLSDLCDNTHLDPMAFSPLGRPFNSLKVPRLLKTLHMFVHGPKPRALIARFIHSRYRYRKNLSIRHWTKRHFEIDSNSDSPSFPSMTRAKSSGVASMLFISEKTLAESFMSKSTNLEASESVNSS